MIISSMISNLNDSYFFLMKNTILSIIKYKIVNETITNIVNMYFIPCLSFSTLCNI